MSTDNLPFPSAPADGPVSAVTDAPGQRRLTAMTAPAFTPVTPLRGPEEVAASFDYLFRLRRDRDRAQQVLDREVGLARQRGLSWGVIGDALGTTRQSAHRRYASVRVSFADQPLPDTSSSLA